MSLNLFDVLIAATLSGGGGGGGSASWGNIGGDITDQSDLVSALALKLNKVVVAGDYNTTSSGYSEGDFCLYNGALYVANEDIAVGAVWDASKWTNKTVVEVIRTYAKTATFSFVSGVLNLTIEDADGNEILNQDITVINDSAASGANVTYSVNKILELLDDREPKHKYIVDDGTTFTLNPGETRRVTGTPASITVTLAAPDSDSDIESHCRLKFEAGSSFASLSVTPPEGYSIVYKDGSLSPQIGKFYEVDYCFLDDANIGCVFFPWTI